MNEVGMIEKGLETIQKLIKAPTAA
jgi:hypothetical protein